jgi:bifunctional non-homologous end joining protein LigD
MPLGKYHAKRDFKVTPEPHGAVRKRGRGEFSFVVQKHQASHLHYDFRLEWNGVLVSWAVPKGPSLDPSAKRLAMAVEDHPLEYGGFEGIIPEGQYGGGTVMVWDRGTWEPEPESEDVDGALRDGELKFSLKGSKLKGSWVLVRTKGFGSKPQWLLIKHKDRYASDADVVAERPRSVVSKSVTQDETEIRWLEGMIRKSQPNSIGSAGMVPTIGGLVETYEVLFQSSAGGEIGIEISGDSNVVARLHTALEPWCRKNDRDSVTRSRRGDLLLRPACRCGLRASLLFHRRGRRRCFAFSSLR